MIKITALKKKNILFLVPLVLLFIGTFLFYLLCVKVRPNDKIITDSKGVALFANENPTFSVNFGDTNQPESQWIRFEAQPSNTNPFSSGNDKNIFNKIAGIFMPDKKVGIEMSLKGVNYSETKKGEDSQKEQEIQKVADILGTDDVKTSTNVIDSGYDIAKPNSEENVSKATVVNTNVAEGIDLEYQILPDKGLKEEIIIQNLDGYSDECKRDITKCKLPLNEYTFDLKMDAGVSLKEGWYLVGGKTTKAYYFVNDKGEYLAHFLPNFAIDNSGNKTSKVDLSVEKKDNGHYEVKVTVDSDWLLDSNRAYPIRIDPSIVHDTSSDFSTGTFIGTRYITGPELQIFDNSVVGSWNMNETTSGTCSGGGDICDQSGNNYNATITGTASSVASIDMYGRDFDGATGTYASLGDLATFEVQSFTIEAYAKKEGTCGTYNYCTILSKGGTGNKGFGFAIYGGKLHLRLNDTGADGVQYLTGTTTLSDNTWYYIAAVVDGTSKSIKLYLNGNLEATGQYKDTISYGTEVVKIGNSNGGNDLPFNGVLDDVKFSNVAKDSSYIQNAYNRYSNGVYKSPIMTLGGVQNVTLLYTASGLKTADGETPYSTTGLVAQWNFNETSGTSAVSGGTCGTSCNGTLTNFASIGSRDVATMSGWTANNRRWGTGALMFDGTDDFVLVTDNPSIKPTSAITVETWVKPQKSGSQVILTKRYAASTDPWNSYVLDITPGNNWDFCISNGTAGSQTCLTSTGTIQLDMWHHLVGTYDGANMKLYVDGILIKSATKTGAIGYSAMGLYFGQSGYSGAPIYFSGVIDSVRIYSRVMTATEVLSDYNIGSIEFQLRGGNSTNPDDGTWSSWTTTTNETAMYSFDNAHLYNATISGLISYWPMDETTGTSLEDVTGSSDGTATGTTVSSGKYSNNRTFNGTSDYLTMPNIIPTTNMSVGMWIYPTSWNSLAILASTRGNTGMDGFFLLVSGGTLFYDFGDGTSNNRWDTGYQPPANTWTYLVATRDSSGRYLYVNGKLQNSTTAAGGPLTSTASLRFGADSKSSILYFYTGKMDEIQVYNRAISVSEVRAHYLQGLSTLGVYQQKPGGIKIEGTNSDRITNSLNDGLVSYWNLDEASGTSLEDSVGSNTGTASGTTVVAGKNNLARNFNGTSDYIAVSTTFGLGTASYSTEAWVNIPSISDHGCFVKIGGTTSGVCVGVGSGTTETNGNNLIVLYENRRWIDTGINIGTGWHHIAMVVDSSGYPFAYLDGNLVYSDTGTTPIAPADSVTGIGNYGAGGSTRAFNGYIDEVKIFNIAKSAQEIQEEYSSLANAYTANNRGLVSYWNLNESGGTSSADSVGTNTGTITGATPIVGKNSLARSFNGSTNYIAMSAASTTNVTNWTLEAWINPANLSQSSLAVYNGNDAGGYGFGVGSGTGTPGAKLQGLFGTIAWIDCGYTFPSANKWYHVVLMRNTSTTYCYVNGVQTGTSTATPNAVQAKASIGMEYTSSNTVANYFAGKIDEVKIYNVARTAAEIANDYMMGGEGLISNESYYVNYNLGSNDLSTKTSVPIYVAGDKPGSYISAILGESSYSNYQADENTNGLWHLDGVNTYGCTGGTMTMVGNDVVHTFTSTGTLTCKGNVNAQVLVVGGGGGGATTGGGGGGGGYVYNSNFPVSEQVYTATVGNGGTPDTSGQNSVFSTITALGGGAGGGFNGAGISGGSGGGGGPSSTTQLTGGTGSQGNNGGSGGNNTNWGGGGGGGGAGSVGSSAGTNVNGVNGGSGLANSISGASVYYAGGGGGGEVFGTAVGIGGSGGGGNANLNAAGSNGAANTGGGGGGGSWTSTSTAGGTGGSGIIIIRYTYGDSVLEDSSGRNSGFVIGAESTTGKIGGGINFNGVSDYIRFNPSDSLTGTFTVDFWIKPTAITVGAELFSTRGPSDTSFDIQLSATGLHGDIGNGTSWLTTAADATVSIPLTSWTHIAYVVTTTGYTIYVDGTAIASGTYASNTPLLYNSTHNIFLGTYTGISYFYKGAMDEVRISNTARTADQIRQAYEVGLRTHDIKIEFGANLSSSNLITGSGDTSFTIDATKQGLAEMGTGLYAGDKIIVREVSSAVEYIAQGNVSVINTTTGATTVLSWDTGSTFPTGGFTAKANVFKWQREYIPIAGKTVSTSIDAISLLTLRMTDRYGGRNIWIDDMKSNGGYINTSGTAVDLGQAYQYVQYQAIFTTANENVSPFLNQVQVDYVAPGPTMDQIMRHGKWFDSSGARKNFWWVN